ncbi:methyltransferase [Bacillus sp. MUM 116]|uniref:class I SAM-dependent methyltransferase n=1 Tax=Bacillus sp. MUM 116 TaxID=1678002 RepID=UPI0008F5AF77|nr:class I SAM-dependent methyltransferase [Bacillus sp. MUM 116]OIK15463.1 methyltransferase [Bacillus sp. MUM 116]
MRADSWHSNSRGMWESGSRKEIIPFLKKYLPDGAAICDLGCGDGFASVKLAKMGHPVTGVDLSEQMLEKASLLAKGTSAQFIKSDISEVPQAANSFDAVMAINSLEWTESPIKVLFEIKRIVKEEGFACIAILGPTAMPRINSFRRLYGEKVICNTMMPWEFEKLAEENGLKKIAEMGVYKREAEKLPVEKLPLELRQSLSFMWVFMFKVK